MTHAPILTVITPVYSGSDDFPLILESLFLQQDERWQLIAVGDSRLAESRIPPSRRGDTRIVLTDSARTETQNDLNRAIEVAAGNFVWIAFAGARLNSTLVGTLAALPRDSRIDVVYGDEDVERGKRTAHHRILKPVYSPERLRCQFYIGAAVFYRTAHLRAVGGLRHGIPGAELYDLALRATASARRVEHIASSLLSHPRGSRMRENGMQEGVGDDIRSVSTRSVLEEYLEGTGGGSVESVEDSGIHRTHRHVRESPLVSIIIPSRGSSGLIHGESRLFVIDAVRSILEKTTYPNYEIVVVMDEIATSDVVAALRDIAGDRLRLLWWRHPFSFSAKINFGAYHAAGQYLLFLNDDIQVISPGWIEAMLSLCQLPGAGMAGAMLYFEDETIQHAGHRYEGGHAAHIGIDFVRGDAGPEGSFRVEREVSGVTAACALMSKRVFEEVGGFSLQLPANFNDVDLCLKVRESGYAIYWTPRAELYHYESRTRTPRVDDYETHTSQGRWKWRMDDPSYWPYATIDR